MSTKISGFQAIWYHLYLFMTDSQSPPLRIVMVVFSTPSHRNMKHCSTLNNTMLQLWNKRTFRKKIKWWLFPLCFSAPGGSKIIWWKEADYWTHIAAINLKLIYDFYLWLLCLNDLKIQTFFCIKFFESKCHRFLSFKGNILSSVEKHIKGDIASWKGKC